MKVLLTIPHYFNPVGNGSYGSTGGHFSKRLQALTESLLALLRSFGVRQAFLMSLSRDIPSKPTFAAVNQSRTINLDVIVCTSGDAHLLQHVKLPSLKIMQVSAPGDPVLLGFACRQILKSKANEYDYFGYLEDDLAIEDPFWFSKLQWFNSQFGDEVVLFPHRFELAYPGPVHKLYIDGRVREDFTQNWQDISDQQFLSAHSFGEEILFERWPNPHSGCFFLNSNQMKTWASSPQFDEIDISFAGPLESAATLGILKNFRIYKPSSQHACFFEIRHCHNRYLAENKPQIVTIKK